MKKYLVGLNRPFLTQNYSAFLKLLIHSKDFKKNFLHLKGPRGTWKSCFNLILVPTLSAFLNVAAASVNCLLNKSKMCCSFFCYFASSHKNLCATEKKFGKIYFQKWWWKSSAVDPKTDFFWIFIWKLI